MGDILGKHPGGVVLMRLWTLRDVGGISEGRETRPKDRASLLLLPMPFNCPSPIHPVQFLISSFFMAV